MRFPSPFLHIWVMTSHSKPTKHNSRIDKFSNGWCPSSILSSAGIFWLIHIRMKMLVFFLSTSAEASQREEMLHQPLKVNFWGSRGHFSSLTEAGKSRKSHQWGCYSSRTSPAIEEDLKWKVWPPLGDRAMARAVPQEETLTAALMGWGLYNRERWGPNMRWPIRRTQNHLR